MCTHEIDFSSVAVYCWTTWYEQVGVSMTCLARMLYYSEYRAQRAKMNFDEILDLRPLLIASRCLVKRNRRNQPTLPGRLSMGPIVRFYFLNFQIF